jgi:hypothetical protein
LWRLELRKVRRWFKLGQQDNGSDENVNSIVDIKKFLSTPENPLTTKEFQEFWSSLSEEEKEEFRKTPLN